MHLVKSKNSSYVYNGLGEAGEEGTGWVAEATIAATTILQLALGKKPETQSDIAKQQIQKQLVQAGYSQFTQMEGWGGDEDRKMQAMATIASVIQQHPGSASQMESWLENGQITPGMISKVRAEYPLQQTTGNSGFLPEIFNPGNGNIAPGNGNTVNAGFGNMTLLYGVLGVALVGVLITSMK